MFDPKHRLPNVQCHKCEQQSQCQLVRATESCRSFTIEVIFLGNIVSQNVGYKQCYICGVFGIHRFRTRLS